MALKINRNLQIILKIIGWALLIALIACMIKILVWERQYYGTKSSETRAKADVVITGIEPAEFPSEDEISEADLNAYQVEAKKPRYLDIERLNLHIRIKESIVNSERLPVPANIHDAMWYAGSGRPGENSTILISGLSKGATKKGAFANLDSLEKGDVVSIEIGQGDKYEYEIQEILIIEATEAVSKLPSVQRRIDDKETLSLITVVKTVTERDSYSSIVIVRATKK
ncbi:class F sortase [Candidatus Saccharibacteria bacterium]|nr:class F sortase [Candidatus Saccharibacteria bacterium]